MDDPLVSMTTLAMEPGVTDLFEHGFFFALEKIDPTVGNIVVTQVKKSSKGKESERIELVDCAELVSGGAYEQYGQKFTNVFDFEQLVKVGNKESDFLCPFSQKTLNVEGEFGSDIFRYIKIVVKGCNLGPNECASEA